jgi:His-Xaa-Ser system protein HxsD
MNQYKFSKELYSKIALIKAAYNFTDIAYIHLDADDSYYYVTIESKQLDCVVSEKEFINEMLTQSVRHEVYQQTKNIRELLLARAMATSVIVDDSLIDEQDTGNSFEENDILKDWFAANEKVEG